MTLEAGITFVHIAWYFIMVFCSFSGGMTIKTSKHCKVIRVVMAIGTASPDVVMPSTVYWEIHLVVIKCGGHPTRVGRVTAGTIGGEISRLVVGIIGLCIIIHMASKAVGWCVLEITIFMTLRTIL